MLFKASFFAFVLSCIWLIYEPGFDTGVATATAFTTFLGYCLWEKQATRPNQIQKISNYSTGIQAGRDVHIK